MSKETIEEATDRVREEYPFWFEDNSFGLGAAWQEQKMYSEAIEFAEWIRIKDFQAASGDNWIGLNMEYYTTQELFNQFKNRNNEQRND